MRYVLAIIFLWLLTGCGPAWHAQQAVRKGAKVKTDTVFQDVITERTITDTVTHFQVVSKIFTDTIISENIRWRSVMKIDTLTKTIYQQIECKPDTLRIPVSVVTEISAGYTKWQFYGGLLAVLIGAGLILWGFLKVKGTKETT